MTKKEFIEQTSFHPYGRHRDNSYNALFYEWRSGEVNKVYFRGYKYCLWGRTVNVTKKELVDTLFNYIKGEITEVPWYMDLVVAQTDQQRFKVPIVASGLYNLPKNK